ncbi:MAG: sialate O-acetylesterase [Chitinophagaceae bacterium]|nr:sialate O-acetylesterase [Chitinophagaceae bacterium]
MIRRKITLSGYLMLTALFTNIRAEVRLPFLISDGMVLQRDVPLTIWGYAAPSEKVTVSFRNKKYVTVTANDGVWSLRILPQKPGGPFNMVIQGLNRIELKDILVGDVWLCSGQSNMQHQLQHHDVIYAEEIRQANYPHIRQFLVPEHYDFFVPQKNTAGGAWKSAVGNDVKNFSAVAYFFAKELHLKYKIPVGIINSTVGGTPVEAWMSEEALKKFPDLYQQVLNNRDTAIQNRTRPVSLGITAEAGISQPEWFRTDYLPKNWRTINVPGYWEDQGLRALDGVVWYRKEISLPPRFEGRPAQLWLGRIVDADEVYVNGIKIGNTTYQYPQRRYTIPEGLLKSGTNVIVVKVTNYEGKGGFVPDKPYALLSGKDTIDLKGTWFYKVSQVFHPRSLRPQYRPQTQPGVLFNGMIAPLKNYAIKGFVWYQGESNVSRANTYAELFAGLIHDWRDRWNMPAAPFLYVQLTSFLDYDYVPGESQWALLREAQMKCLSLNNTAMAVAIDLGEWNDIHPDNKKEVGIRLALGARAKAYGEHIVHSGPLWKSAEIQQDKIILQFDHTGSGLIFRDSTLHAPGRDEWISGFAIAGEDKQFVWANARIEGNSVVVWSEKVNNPKYVRYLWADNPVNITLYNKDGLPASPFRTDQ